MARDQECLDDDRRRTSSLIKAALLVLWCQELHHAFLQFRTVRKTRPEDGPQSARRPA
jgi:hypothetical protein